MDPHDAATVSDVLIRWLPLVPIDTIESSFHNRTPPDNWLLASDRRTAEGSLVSKKGREEPSVKPYWKAKSADFNGFFGEGTSLTGELIFSGTLRVDGSVHGSIKTSDTLIVGDGAVIHADIQAGEVQIHGAVFGKIDGKRRVDIFSTGRLKGDVRTPRLVIEEGGLFEGVSQIPTDSMEDSDAVQDTEGSSRAPVK